MPFNWREYLALAEHVQGQSGLGFGQEAAGRCAVSRAYYAAFCYARNQATARYGFTPSKTAADHAALRQHLRDHKRYREARWLDRLRGWRNQCDYADDVTDIPLLVVSSLKEASNLIHNI